VAECGRGGAPGAGLLRFWVLAGALSAGAVAAGAETVVLEAVERGTFRENGSFELGPEAAYAVGRGGAGEERAVFVFDASALEGAATSATLRIWSSAAGFVNAGPVERVAVYAVSGDPAALAWKPWEAPVFFEPRPRGPEARQPAWTRDGRPSLPLARRGARPRHAG